MLIFSLLLLLLLVPSYSSGAVFFEDSFESGDFTYYDPTSGAGWTGVDYGTANEEPEVNTVKPHTGTYSASFTFEGNSDLGDDAFSELRYTLGTQQTEVYMSYWIYFPANYTTRDSGGANNNKLIRLWGDDEVNDDTRVGMSSSLGDKVFFEAKESGWPLELDCGGTMDPLEGSDTWNIIKDQWVYIEMHLKLDSGSGDGALQLWINNVLVSNNTNLSWIDAPCASGFFRHGYLLGWANSGFDEDTTVYIDDVTFSTTRIGEDSTTTHTSACSGGFILQ